MPRPLPNANARTGKCAREHVADALRMLADLIDTPQNIANAAAAIRVGWSK